MIDDHIFLLLLFNVIHSFHLIMNEREDNVFGWLSLSQLSDFICFYWRIIIIGRHIFYLVSESRLGYLFRLFLFCRTVRDPFMSGVNIPLERVSDFRQIILAGSGKLNIDMVLGRKSIFLLIRWICIKHLFL